MGYGLGYIGGSTIPLLIFLIMNAAGGRSPCSSACRSIFGFTAVWWFVFSLPLLKNCEQKFRQTLRKGRHWPQRSRGVFAQRCVEIGPRQTACWSISSAYFFYIDGVHTIISMSTSYGTNLGLDSTGMLLALLLVQVLGLPFCLLYMKLGEPASAPAPWWAWASASTCSSVCSASSCGACGSSGCWRCSCATSQGGIQALSRSMFGKLIPDKERSGEFFGFFDIFGKFSLHHRSHAGGHRQLHGGHTICCPAQGLTAATATAEQVDAINAASSPYGILSAILIIVALGACAVLLCAAQMPEQSGKTLRRRGRRQPRQAGLHRGRVSCTYTATRHRAGTSPARHTPMASAASRP